MIPFLTVLAAILLHLPVLQDNPAVVPFNTEIISTFPNVRDFTISSAGDEAYFTVQSPMSELSAIATIKKINGKWSEPQIVSFSGQYSDMEPFLSVDDLRLYFVSNRPINSDSSTKDYDIWYVERGSKDATWSTPLTRVNRLIRNIMNSILRFRLIITFILPVMRLHPKARMTYL